MRIQHTQSLTSQLVLETPGDNIAFGELRKAFSVLDPNRYAIKSFRDHFWDGRHYAVDKRGNFLRGLTDSIVEWGRERGVAIAAEPWNQPIPEEVCQLAYSTDLVGIDLWPHQRQMAYKMLRFGGGTGEATTGSGKSEVISLIIKILFALDPPPVVMFLVHRIGLMEQTRDRFCERVPELAPMTGLLGDGKQPPPGCRVVFASIKSVLSGLGLTKRGVQKENIVELVNHTTHFIVDECHHVSQGEYQELFKVVTNPKIFQVSGTPEVQDKLRDWGVIGTGGPIVFRVTRGELESRGIIAKAVCLMRSFGSAKVKRTHGWMPKTSDTPQILRALRVNEDGEMAETTITLEPNAKIDRDDSTTERLIFPDYARDSLILHEARNQDMAQFVEACLQLDRNVVVLCERIAQVYLVAALLRKRFKVAVAHGTHTVAERTKIKQRFAKGEIDVLVGSTIFGEGEDIQGVGAVAIAGGGSSFVRQVQWIGRGVRRKTHTTNWCPVWFPVDFENKFTRDQTLERLEFLTIAGINNEEYAGTDWVSHLKELDVRMGAS